MADKPVFGGGLFGKPGASTGASPFGAAAAGKPGPSLFGSNNTSGAAAPTSLFGSSSGGASGAEPSKSLFGAAAPTTSFSFGQKPGGAQAGAQAAGISAPGASNAFGSAPTSGPPTGVFGAKAQAATPATSLFGGQVNKDASSAKPPSSLFGGAPASASGPVPAASGPAPSLFGGLAKPGGTSAPTAAPSLFGGPGSPPGAPATQNNSLFGSQQSKSGAMPSSAPTASVAFGAAAASAPSAPSSLFGGATSAKPATASSTFGFGGAKPGPAPATASTGATPAGSATPAPNKTMFGLGSTTPAGPPPAGGAKTPAPSLFGSMGAQSQQKQAPSLFPSAPKPTPATNTAQSAPSLFGGAAPTSALGSGAATSSAAPAAPATASSAAQQNSIPSTATPKLPSFGLGQPASKPATSSGPSLFGGLGGAPAAANPGSTPTSSGPAPAKSLFGTMGSVGPQVGASTSANPPAGASTGLPNTATSQAITKPLGSTSDTTSAFGLGASTATAPSNPTTNATNLGASTIGPAPTAQSRLKNKSMDEIITRWASDLSKYQKDFQAQATQVAQWDRLLVENSDRIAKLVQKTLQAERDAGEVEKQLATVESQQDELSAWLDKYEKEIEEMEARVGGLGDGALQGPDQERERTYKLTEKLSDRLNELNKDLGDMIGEINTVSSTLSKTNKTDDPLSQVVRVLNSHLAQLQIIDAGAAELKAKVEAAQKDGARLGASWNGGLGNDHAADFGRSWLGRR